MNLVSSMIACITADGDRFGFAVALSGDASRFVIGAPFNRASSADSGRVMVFQVS